MVKSRKQQWQNDFSYFAYQYRRDQKKVKHLVHQIHWLICKHTDTKYNIALESQQYGKKIKKIHDLRQKVEHILSLPDVKLSAKYKAKLRKLQSTLPISDSLLDRIRLMELLDELPTFSENVHQRMHHLQSLHRNSLKRMARHQEELKYINGETRQVINDIKELLKILEYLRKSRRGKWKIKPSLVRSWLERLANCGVRSTVGTSNKQGSHKIYVRPP
ncbi:hypothetical protein AWZ03_008509 [Drosophila navojoa]|uniref:Uncharacterized protein n=1 Tax=Drosophila navojoa TaxID=7232 RepID=A0A484B8V7_DRONA|nr:hypothetical protein AWZ03_008509 [Drosophila navojoa]